jgi:hypothetical protein
VVRALGLAHAGRREQAAQRAEEFKTRQEAIEAASQQLEMLAADPALPEDVVAQLRAHQDGRLEQTRIRGTEDDEQRKRVARADEIERLLIEAERDLINDKYRQGALKDETRRRLERELDLREAQLESVRSED